MSLFVMTGATSGIGLQTARQLLNHPQHELIVGARDPQNATALRRLAPEERLKISPLDTSSLKSVRTFASVVQKTFAGRRIAAIGLNAGMQPSNAVQFTEDDVEACFAANYLGQYCLSELLQPMMEHNGAIIFTASGAHNKADPVGKRLGYRGHQYSNAANVAAGELTLSETTSPAQSARGRYATSKFCLLLYVFSTVSLRKHENVRLIAFDPGAVPGTQIVRDLGLVAKFSWAVIFPVVAGLLAGFSTKNRSGDALAKLMVHPELAPQTGLHIDYRLKTAKDSPDTHDNDLQNDLISYSASVCK